MKRLLVLLSCILFAGAAFAADDFKAGVDAAVQGFNEAIQAKDAARIGNLYAEDAIAFPPNSESVSGRAAIQAFWKGFIDGGMGGKVESVETQSDGNMGYEVGKYTIMDASGKTVDQGKYVVVYKKTKDGWMMYRDIWNTNMAAQ